MTPEIRKLLASLAEAQRLGENARHTEARAVLMQVYARARDLGLESGQLLWQLAVACDLAGEPEEALGIVIALIRLDPLSGAGLSSLRIIAGRVREALCDPDRGLDNPSTPTSYTQLIEVGEASAQVHLAAVRYYAAAGKTERSLAIIEALLVLEPGNSDVWEALSEMGKQVNRPELVRRAAMALVGLRHKRGQVLLLGSGGGDAQA